jgi:hypothetical protein
MRSFVSLISALGIWLVAATAQAQDYVRPDCRPLISPAKIADPLTAKWYRRFWTGDCGHLSGCFGGTPNWNDIVGRLMSRAAAGQKVEVLRRACRLGPLIGLEWTRPKRVRRIDSRDLQSFKSVLDSSPDVVQALSKVEASAQSQISRGRGSLTDRGSAE